MKLTSRFGLILSVIILVLVSCKAQQQVEMKSKELINQKYIITHIADKQLEDSNLTLKVNTENSTISGFSGCNNFSYNYKLDNGVLDLGYAMATKMYCEDEMNIENLFFKTTSSVAQFENSNEQIILKSESGDILIKAKKKESE